MDTEMCLENGKTRVSQENISKKPYIYKCNILSHYILLLNKICNLNIENFGHKKAA